MPVGLKLLCSRPLLISWVRRPDVPQPLGHRRAPDPEHFTGGLEVAQVHRVVEDSRCLLDKRPDPIMQSSAWIAGRSRSMDSGSCQA
jgi:hypothetical protein